MAVSKIGCLVFMCVAAVYEVEACKPGFHKYGGSCYWLSRIVEDFSGARSMCQYLGAHLAFVTNASEDRALRQLIFSYGKEYAYYLGASDVGLENVWSWEGGTPLTYTNWAPGEPSQGSQHCLAMNKGFSYKWDDLLCDRKVNFICEYEI